MLIIPVHAIFAQYETPGPDWLADRGTGLPLSIFGNYINKGEFIFYPFYEYYYDQDAEYKPQELGYNVNIDYRGKYKAHEGLLFFAYGFTEKLAVEFEMAMISATQYKSGNDVSNMPGNLHESGPGDIEGQIRYRWNKETARHPEFFSYYETVFPSQKNKYLIGTQDWEFKLGHGVIKGFTWGTMTVRAALAYDVVEKKTEIGEYAVEYLKRISPRAQIYLGVEGTQDEVEFITDVQIKIISKMALRLNNAFGISSKATDYAPEFGLMFRF